jgi:hypothetical protein
MNVTSVLSARRFLSAVIMLPLLAAGTAARSGEAPSVLDIAGANSADNRLLWLDFDGPATEVLNTDANAYASLRSVGFFKNTCENRLDVVAADGNLGKLPVFANGRGVGVDLCAAGACPPRPDGISFDAEGRMAVVNTGAGGTVPGLWLFEPAACDSDGPFEAPVSAGHFHVGAGSGTPVGGLSDTEAVAVPGGGLDPGDLLVLTSAPTTLARVRAQDIQALLGSGALPPADILLGPSFFGTAAPTGMAFVRGTAGVGSPTDDRSQSEDLLVALGGGRILKLNFETDGLNIFLDPDDDRTGLSPLQSRVFLDQQLGIGTLGIAAGARDDETFMVIADRQRGRFLRFPLEVLDKGLPCDPLLPDGPTGVCLRHNGDGSLQFQEITATVQHPQGVDVNSEVFAAGECVDVAGTTDQTGCRIGRTLELHFTQGLSEGFALTDTVLASIRFIEDTRGEAGGPLALPGFGAGFTIPDSCRGFRLSDDSSPPVLVAIEVGTNFAIAPGNFVQAKETVEAILPQLPGCRATGASIYYHPDPPDPDNPDQWDTPEQGELLDLTFFCRNPSRSLEWETSPVVLCADTFAQSLNAGTDPKKLVKPLQAELTRRTDNLALVAAGLPESFGALRSDLSAILASAKQEIKKGKFAAASGYFDACALAVYSEKTAFETDDSLRATFYGELFARCLAQAYYSLERGTLGDYCPPEILRTGDSPELIDIDCS